MLEIFGGKALEVDYLKSTDTLVFGIQCQLLPSNLTVLFQNFVMKHLMNPY